MTELQYISIPVIEWDQMRQEQTDLGNQITLLNMCKRHYELKFIPMDDYYQLVDKIKMLQEEKRQLLNDIKDKINEIIANKGNSCNI